MTQLLTKRCPVCKKILPKSDFSKNHSRYDGLQTYCKSCFNIYRKQHYNKNKHRYSKWIADKKKELKQKYLLEKSKSICCDCGISYPDEPWLMEYDHKSGNKIANVSKIVREGSTKKIQQEIDKCDIVCVLCHRRRTAKRGNWTFTRESAIV